MTKKDYSQAIFIAKLVSFIGWIVIIAGIIGALTFFSDNSSTQSPYIAIVFVVMGMSSIIATLLGFILIIVGQATRAMMDNANHSAAILEILKKNNLEEERIESKS